MARQLNKLTAMEVNKASKPGFKGDGGGLWLQIGPTGAKSWVFRYTRHGKSHMMGLGALHTVLLAEAREKALECRKLLDAGYDPLEEKKKQKLALRLDAAKAISFSECAIRYIEAQKDSWKSPKSEQQWTNTLKAYAFPVIGDLAVADVNTGLVMQCLEPIWHTKTETATRVRGRIEKVLDWAKVREYRTGENPARWSGHLSNLLPSPSKIKTVNNHPALPYADIAEFFVKLEKHDSISGLALAFVILTNVRVTEALKSTWDEIILEKKLWIIPAERMKASEEHHVPLSTQALTILEKMQECRQSDYVFPGQRVGGHVSDSALRKLLNLTMGYSNDYATIHGFRSTFRDWAEEQTHHESNVIEKSMAHKIPNAAEAAYRRGQILEKRRILMQDWADYCFSGIIG